MTGDTDFLDRYMDRLAVATTDSVREALRRLVDRGAWVEISVGPDLSNGAKTNGVPKHEEPE